MTESLSDLQRSFAGHLRDPARYPVPSTVDPRRMAVYRELFFNNIDGLLSANFPVLRRTLDEPCWRSLVEEFCCEHRAQTPLFTEIGQEFVHFLDARPDDSRAPWLTELAHYEWIELALQIADDPLPAHAPQADLLDDMLLLSPYCRALAYQWPAHRIGPHYLPDTAPSNPSLLLARRQADGSIMFSELSPLLFRLIELLEAQSSRSGLQLLQQLAAEASMGPTDDFIADGKRMLERLRDQGCLLDMRRD